MSYRHLTDACFTESIGRGGLKREDYAAVLGEAAPALAQIRGHYADGSLPLLRLPERRDDIAQAAPIARRFRDRFTEVVVLGTGGSSLGGKSLTALTDYGYGPERGGPRLHFFDNVDPDGFAALERAADLKRTGLIVISKSGTTAETLTQFLTLVPAFAEAGVGTGALKDHVLCITEPGDNPLRRFAARWNLETLDHDPKVGGRFSVLSVVGLLPAMIAGLDAIALRLGAQAVLEGALNAEDPAHSAPAVGAAIAVGLWRSHRIGISVLMPYLDRLAQFGMWYRQLWAESLGKQGLGTTPIRAMGTVDQHSQLQLYLDGPADKMFTLVMGKVAGTGRRIAPGLIDDDRLDYLAGHSMGDLLAAEQLATAQTLARRGRPTRTMEIERLDEKTMGALMMHFMLETIIAARLLRIDAFDQPAVEEGKILARRYLAEQKS